MSENKFLILRKGGGWAFSIAIPAHLRAEYLSKSGKPRARIVEGLSTDKLAIARKLRDRRLAFWRLCFDPLLQLGPERPAQAAQPAIKSDGRLHWVEAAELHLAALCRDPAAAPRASTIQGQRAIHALFAGFIENAPIASITRAQANDFLTHVGQERKLSSRSLNKYSITLAGVFRAMRDMGRWDGSNPFDRKGFRVARDAGWLPFTPAELALLVPSKPIDALGWCMWISLYSGQRLNECAGLQVQDIRQVEGVWVFDVRQNAERRLKTPAATRLIPVHSKLIAAGLLDYVNARPQGPLFDVMPGGPDKKPGIYLGSAFTEYRRSLGVDRPRVSYHSYRKSFTGALDRAGVPLADASALLGHGRGFSWDIYSSGPGIARLQGLVERVGF